MCDLQVEIIVMDGAGRAKFDAYLSALNLDVSLECVT